MINACLITILSIGCKKQQTELQVTKVDELTTLRKSLGIESFKDINFDAVNKTTFHLQAKTSEVNGIDVNFNDAIIEINRGEVTTEVNATFSDNVIGKLKFEKNTGTLTYYKNNVLAFQKNLTDDGQSQSDLTFKKDDMQHEIEAIFLMSLMSDPFTKKSNTEDISSVDFTPSYKTMSDDEPTIDWIDNGDGCTGVTPYYGYTVGWGSTRTVSEDHEKDVRKGSSNIAKYRFLGVDTTCVLENHFCVTTATFKCCE